MQLLRFCPPLEQPPDQIALRPFETLNVTDCPVEYDADPVLPTGTLNPAGFEVTRSPDRPLAVSDTVAVPEAAVTVNDADFDTPPAVAVIVTGVDPDTDDVAIEKVALVAPCGTVTVAGAAAALLLLDNDTDMPPAGAAPLNVTLP